MKSCYFFSKSDASSAVNTSIHVGDNERSDIFVLDCSFELVVPSVRISVEMRIVLEIALTTLIADGAVEGVVG